MRVAHVILVHKNPAQVAQLVSVLAHPDIDCYVHVDAKADIGPYLFLKQIPRVYLINDRVDIRWAEYSLVLGMRSAMAEALSRGQYGYINLISGQDLPLQPATRFLEFLETHQGKEFITCYVDPRSGDPEAQRPEALAWWKDAGSHAWNYNLDHWRMPGKYLVQKLANLVLPARKFPLDAFALAGRSGWFTLSSGALSYAIKFLDTHPELARFFKYAWGSDELVYSTILYNSHFRDKVADNLLYTDWSEGKPNPKVLRMEDLHTLMTSGKFFARKFDPEVDPEIMEQLKAHSLPALSSDKA